MTPETYKAEFAKLLASDSEDFAERLWELDMRADADFRSGYDAAYSAEEKRVREFITSPEEQALLATDVESFVSSHMAEWNPDTGSVVPLADGITSLLDTVQP